MWMNKLSFQKLLEDPEIIRRKGTKCPNGVKISGRNTAHSGMYTDELAKFIHKGICLP